MCEILVIRLPRAWKWVSKMYFFIYFSHIRYRGHKQKIIKSVNRFNKISLGQKGLLLTTNRILVWNSPGRRRSLVPLSMPLVTQGRRLCVFAVAQQKGGFSRLFSDVMERAPALPLSDIPYCTCHSSPIKMSPHRGLSFSGGYRFRIKTTSSWRNSILLLLAP